jgi:peptidoglycan/LPS O-acetylase OafA/YrhL
VIVLTVLSALSVILEYVVLDPVPEWFGTSVAGYVLWFALGMGLAIASVGFGAAERPPWVLRLVAARPGLVWGLAAAGYALLCARLPPTSVLFVRSDQLDSHLASAGIAALLLAPAVFADRPGLLPHRLLAHRVVAWLGLVSYGIFLYHQPFVFAFLNTRLWPPFAGIALYTALVIAAATACAAASYYLVERPLLRFKESGGARARSRAHAVAAKSES